MVPSGWVVRDVVTLRPLAREGDELVERESAAVYDSRGIPVLARWRGWTRDSRRCMTSYAKLRCEGTTLLLGYAHTECAGGVFVRTGGGTRVLGVAVGTGRMRGGCFLRRTLGFMCWILPCGTLWRRQRSLTKDGRVRRFALFEGEAEHLPFRGGKL